jgi:Allene oxide cyclase barrel like domain
MIKVARRAAVLAVVLMVVAGLPAWPSGAATRPVTQTLVFDAVGRGSFVDQPPAGPSPGDTEFLTARLRDAAGRFVGSSRATCVFTKVIPTDVLERCSASGRTSEGTLSFGGVGHLESLNPAWQVTGGTGAYKGVRGKLVFEADIPLDPNVPLAAGRLFSVAVFKLTANRRLHVGVVPRPAANAVFIRHANSACDAKERQAMTLPGFPFSTFDPFHPDKNLLPRVGRFFNQPARRRLPGALLKELEKLGQPPASSAAWQKVLKARKVQIMNESTQIKAALADDAPAFVRTVYQQARDYNQLVFSSAVFGVQACTFS